MSQKDMSQNRSLLIIEVGNVVRLLLLSQATNAQTDGIFSNLKCVKTYLSSNVGACSHNILDNINSAGVANQFVDRKDNRKQTFRHLFRIIHNIYKMKLTT